MKETSGNEELVYEPPRALRVGSMHTGEGGLVPTCRAPGSGAEGDCSTGSNPTGWCAENGNSAAGGCELEGIGGEPPDFPA